MFPRSLMFTHLARLTDHRGIFEHADGIRPRLEHGYCTDDNARLLLVTSRERYVEPAMHLSRIAHAFTMSAQTPAGRTRNRMSVTGEFTDAPTTDDCWGRSLWALGTAARIHSDANIRTASLAGFGAGAVQRSRWSRAMAFAALGAAEVFAADPEHGAAKALLSDAAALIGAPGEAPWIWPEPRLRYANASVAEALIAIGAALEDWAILDHGLAMLGWLLDRETRDGHLSVTGSTGSDVTTTGPQFDQQPIEVAAMADACWRALSVTGNQRWSQGLLSAGAWFEGRNDIGLVMFDVETGGGYDGLHIDRVNKNQGAESTLALVSTMQRVESLQESRT